MPVLLCSRSVVSDDSRPSAAGMRPVKPALPFRKSVLSRLRSPSAAGMGPVMPPFSLRSRAVSRDSSRSASGRGPPARLLLSRLSDVTRPLSAPLLPSVTPCQPASVVGAPALSSSTS